SLFLVPLGYSQAALRTNSVSGPSNEQKIEYVGAYSADGKYQPASKMASWYNREAVAVTNATARPPEVPPFVDLHSRERVVENLKPPLHATHPAKGRSFWAGVRDNIITFAYGREQLLLGPHHVVVDSTGRVILTDPAAHAIHVLDGEKSFRISAGPNRRLFSPGGIAVDADDNIYVADSEQGLIAVFDRHGTFLRYLGRLGRDETLFHYPVGIAIDRRAGRIYVLDSERHLMVILDLQGRELKRVGRYNGNDTVVEFEYPTAIAVGQGELAIMDAAGSRIWITDLDGTPRTKFRFSASIRRGIVDELGLAVDADNRIYISNALNSNVDIYDSEGRRLQTISRLNQPLSNFQRPTGLWIDAANRLFVADEAVRRVELFQVREVKPAGD
ncbi:MAG: 6-bladed beta-propeller, partial [Terriglobales bacterium]